MSELPQPTEDLAQVKTQLDTYGYGLLANALNAEDLSKIKTRLKEQTLAEKQRGLAFEDGGAKQNWGDFRNQKGQVRTGAFTQSAGGVNQRVWMLINKGRVFQDMLLHTGVRNIVDHALGNDYLLSSHSANIAKPGGVPMRLHTDQWWMPMPTHADRTHLPAGSITREQTDEADTASIWPPRRHQRGVDDRRLHSRKRRHPHRPRQSPVGQTSRQPRRQRHRNSRPRRASRHSWISRRTHLARHRSQYKRPNALGHTHHILRSPIPSTGKFYRGHGTRSPRRGIARSPVSTRIQSVECLWARRKPSRRIYPTR